MNYSGRSKPVASGYTLAARPLLSRQQIVNLVASLREGILLEAHDARDDLWQLITYSVIQKSAVKG